MKYLKSTWEWKEYKAYPEKIVYTAKADSSGLIRVSKTLRYFSNIDFLYIKVNNKMKKFKTITNYDRGHLVYRAYVGYSNRNKNFIVYLKTSQKFKKIVNKALNSKSDILKKYNNPNFRLYINEDGKLLLRFLVNLGSKASAISKLLNKQQATIPLGTYSKFINKSGLNGENLSPFVTNYYVKEATITIPPSQKIDFPNPKMFRLIGLINGDGTLTKYGAYFYGNDKILHKDFRKISLSLDRSLKIKNCIVPTTEKTYWYCRKLVKKLNKYGGIYNRKLDFIEDIELPKDLEVYLEYLSGIYDTEGTIIDDSHIVLPTSVTIHNKNIKILTKKELRYLFLLSKNHGIFKHFRETDSKSYSLGLNKLKENKKSKQILTKLRNHFPGLALVNQRILNDLNINSKLELKAISVYHKKEIITASWWVKITLIKDVIKFAAIIRPHLKRKQKKLNDFIFNYITPEEFKEIKFLYKNGSQTMGTSP